VTKGSDATIRNWYTFTKWREYRYFVVHYMEWGWVL